MTNFEGFISGSYLFYIRNEKVFIKLQTVISALPLSYPNALLNYSYLELRKNCGVIVIPEGQLVGEFSMHKGFAFQSMESARKAIEDDYYDKVVPAELIIEEINKIKEKL